MNPFILNALRFPCLPGALVRGACGSAVPESVPARGAASQPVVSTAIGEDKGRFQVALLTLGATHARFGHTQEALSALNESVRPKP